MEDNVSSVVKSEILSRLINQCKKNNIDENDVEVESVGDHTYYLAGKKVLLVVEWRGFRPIIYE